MIAGDSIKRALAEGQPRIISAWLGPTKLATAIMYATVTNIVAYLPFLLVTGSTGEFLHSLPIVMTVALIASRLVSMSFLPMLGYYLLRPEKKVEKTLEERRNSGFFGLVCPGSEILDRTPLEVLCRFPALPGSGRIHLLPVVKRVLSRRCSVLVLHRCMAAQRCHAGSHQSDGTQGGADCPRKGGAVFQGTPAKGSSRRCVALRHDLCRRRRPALLVLGLTSAAAIELCAGADRSHR